MLQLREWLRGGKETIQEWERYKQKDVDNDIYYQKKYGVPKMPLFQHRGSCDCGALQFLILAPKRVEAFDDSNAVSCKKGRFPYLLLPVSCFEMVQAMEVSIYEKVASNTQHAFCKICGVHVLHFDHSTPEIVAVNVYCVDDDNLEDVKIIFVPKGSRPMVGSESPDYRLVRSQLSCDRTSTLNLSFQKQLMVWARLGECDNSSGSDDAQSCTSTSSHTCNQRYSYVNEEQPVQLADMKNQLQFYLKRHLEEGTSPEDNQTHV